MQSLQPLDLLPVVPHSSRRSQGNFPGRSTDPPRPWQGSAVTIGGHSSTTRTKMGHDRLKETSTGGVPVFFIWGNKKLIQKRNFESYGAQNTRNLLLKKQVSCILCTGEDLNLHALRHTHLKRTCLPITSPVHHITTSLPL